MFKERSNPATQIKVVEELTPTVYIKERALIKMNIYVDECADEVGWFGTAYRGEDGNILIDDVFLFDQEVNATTTEITPEGLSEFAQEVMSNKEDGVEIWDNLKMWGHSHVNMPLTPSAQDDKQMVEFKEGGHDWFIRLIANKQGLLKVDLYDYEAGVAYLDLPWYQEVSDEQQVIYRQIQELTEKLEAISKATHEEEHPLIKAEMAKKVRKKVYARTSYTSGKLTAYTHASHARRTEPWYEKDSFSDVPSGDLWDAYAEDSHLDHSYLDYSYPLQGYANYFLNDEEVCDTLHESELSIIAKCRNVAQAKETIDKIGLPGILTDEDVARVFRVSKTLC